MTQASPVILCGGSGAPRREFLYVEDMAAASIFVMYFDKATNDGQTPMPSYINLGFGSDITIHELAQTYTVFLKNQVNSRE
jgi:GDP-L-fucose synthase